MTSLSLALRSQTSIEPVRPFLLNDVLPLAFMLKTHPLIDGVVYLCSNILHFKLLPETDFLFWFQFLAQATSLVAKIENNNDKKFALDV